MKTEVYSKQVRNKVKLMHELEKDKKKTHYYSARMPQWAQHIGLSENGSYIKPPRLVRKATERPTITLKELQSSGAESRIKVQQSSMSRALHNI